jgi:hypothetical protein
LFIRESEGKLLREGENLFTAGAKFEGEEKFASVEFWTSKKFIPLSSEESLSSLKPEEGGKFKLLSGFLGERSSFPRFISLLEEALVFPEMKGPNQKGGCASI